MVTIRGRQECGLYDAMMGHGVRCVFDDTMLKDLLRLFGHQVVAEGEITAYAGGVGSNCGTSPWDTLPPSEASAVFSHDKNAGKNVNV